MQYMFTEAKAFNQCLGAWARRTPANVKVSSMFLDSGCEITRDQDQTESTWCRACS